VNVDCRGWGMSVVRTRILAAGLALLGAGCAVLGLASHSRHVAPTAAHSASADVRALSEDAGLLAEAPRANADIAARARSIFAGLPLIFEPNLGQGNLNLGDERAKFVARGSGYSLFFGSEGAILSLASRDLSRAPKSTAHYPIVRVDSLQMKLVGANRNMALTSADRLPGHSNYIIGNDPAKWRTGVPQFARVRYENVYPGIDLVFYGNQGQLEYDFQVAPGARPEQAELEFNGASGLELNQGCLVIRTGNGSVKLEAPRVYQEIAGNRQPVEANFVLRGSNRAGFVIGSYDRSRELIIDPILTFSTYFGGSGDELSTSVAVDGSFDIYLTGSTTSPDLPITPVGPQGVVQQALGGAGPNVYVAKIVPPLGNLPAGLSYVTYLGGNGSDTPVGIKVDGGYHPFVAGTTTSTNFPTSGNAYQNAPQSASSGTSSICPIAGANCHVFVTELSSDATALAYSSYLSGNGNDVASGMTIDALGDLLVTGTTTSTNSGTTSVQFPASALPETVAYQPAPKGPIQFFLTKVNTGSERSGSIAYSTYFGGGTFNTATPVALGGGVAVDTSNNVYFSGTTNYTYVGCAGCSATDFPILNAYQPCLDQPPPATPTIAPVCTYTPPPTASDAFVAKLNLNPNTPAGQQLVWSTYVGGSGDDSSSGVGLDPGAANVYLVGTTNSINYPLGITTLSTSASFQTCLDTPVNPAAGTPCPTPSTTPYPTDAFVARLTNPTNTISTTIPTNVALNYFSYLGGTSDENGLAITVDTASGALVTGWTTSSDFPVAPATNSIQSVYGGAQDAFVARINTAAVIGQTTTASWASYFGGSGTDSGTGIALDANQDTYLAGTTNSTNLQVAKPLTPAQGGGYKGGYDAFVAQLGTAVSLSLQGTLTLGNNQTFISAGNPATFTYIVTNNGPDLATNLTLTDNLSSSITGVPVTFGSASTSSGTCGGVSTNAIVSCTLPSLQSGSTATVTIVITPTANSNGNQATFNGGTVQVMSAGNIVLAQTSVPAVMSDFSMQVNPTNNSVPVAGDTATYQVQLTPHPLYTSAITVSCSNLPTQSTCAVAPSSSITVESSSGATATLSVTTTARPVPSPAASLWLRRFYAVWLGIPGLSLLFVGMGGSRRRRRIAGILMLCILSAMLLLLPACSHTNQQPPVSGTPAGNYTITVTATSGSDSKSQTIGLVVP
jgi:uncharacterized repeat protein (TIGR01451 family)